MLYHTGVMLKLSGIMDSRCLHSCFLFSEALRAVRHMEDAASTMRDATRKLTTVVERMESAAQNGK